MSAGKLIVRELLPYTTLPSSALWADSAMVSHLANYLSICLEVIEPMVMRAIKYSMPHLSEDLYIEAEKFIKQESNHASFHQDWNDNLISMGYAQLDKVKKSLLDKFCHLLQPAYGKDLLIVSTIFEHMTCQVARFFLEYLKKHRDLIQPFIGYVIGYHAIEEIEHKAVCFNCCLACFDSTEAMQQAIAKVWFEYASDFYRSMVKGMFYLLYKDGLPTERKQMTTADIENFLEKQVQFSEKSSQLSAILDEDFNPDDVDDSAQIMYWDNELGPYLINRIELN